MLFLFLLATELIDLEMAPQEKKKTGLHKLSDKERGSLQNWIDTHYEKRSAPIAVKIVEKKPTVLRVEIKGDNTFVSLTDGSSWQIHPKDAGIALGWINPDVEIIVHPGEDSSYSTLLTNTLSGSSVRSFKSD